MSRRLVPALFLPACLIGLAACQSGQQGSSGSAEAGPSRADIAFINAAGVSGLDEVRFAQLAMTHAGDPSVRDFAARIVADDTPVNQDLATLAQREGIAASFVMDGRHQEQYHHLESLRGPAFDRVYTDGQLQDLTLRIQAFQSEADSGKDPQIRDFAQRNLPMTLEHLRMVPRIGG